METRDIINIILSVCTILLAIVSIFISIQSIKNSNKQKLFDKRYNVYSIFLELRDLVETNKNCTLDNIDKSSDVPYSMEFDFNCFTNCPFLEELQGTLNNVLENNVHRTFLLKLNELKKISDVASFLFKDSDLLSKFISSYANLLHEMYRYEILYSREAEACTKNNINNSKILNQHKKVSQDIIEQEKQLSNDSIYFKKLKKEIKIIH